MNNKTIDELVKKLRSPGKNHEPDDNISVKMKDIETLCFLAENVLPSITLLERRLERGDFLSKHDEKWWLFNENGESVASGESLRDVLISLIWIDC